MQKNDNFDPAELAKFSDLAHRWWAKESEFRPLHQINPLRLEWIENLIPLKGLRVLDVGCGAGSHSLYLQNDLNLKVLSIDSSDHAVRACQLRGLANVVQTSFLEFDTAQKFDTILLLMNGTGIFETLVKTGTYLQKLKSLLSENGQILIDSSDLIYMFDEDEDGAKVVRADGYYGELTFTISYKNEIEAPFPWLYLDFNTLQNAGNDSGFLCELICEGENFDYLAKLKHLNP